MTLDEARAAVVAVLKDIQARSGLPCPNLTQATIPPKELEKFDSTVWPAATTLIARKLNVTIPSDVHIFGDRTNAALTIAQIAAVVCAKSKSKVSIQEAA